MTFGLDQTDGVIYGVRVRGVDNIRPFLDMFTARGHDEVDTARLYGGGDTEIVSFCIAFETSLLTKISYLKIRIYLFCIALCAFSFSRLWDSFTLKSTRLRPRWRHLLQRRTVLNPSRKRSGSRLRHWSFRRSISSTCTLQTTRPLLRRPSRLSMSSIARDALREYVVYHRWSDDVHCEETADVADFYRCVSNPITQQTYLLAV